MAYVKCLKGIKGSEIPEGSTATPTDIVETLLNCAGIFDKEYTTIAQLIADTTSLNTVITSNNAIDYLVRSTTFASSVTADQTTMSYIGLNNYASNTLLADSTWASAICNSTYFESVLNVKVPVMTSNTTPSGECVGTATSAEAYMAFDGDDTTQFMTYGATASTSPNVDKYCGYIFQSSVKVYCAKWLQTPASSSNAYSGTAKLQYSDDNLSWEDFYSFTLQSAESTNIETYIFSTALTHKGFRVFTTAGNFKSSENKIALRLRTLQFYGRVDV